MDSLADDWAWIIPMVAYSALHGRALRTAVTPAFLKKKYLPQQIGAAAVAEGGRFRLFHIGGY